MGRYSLDHMNYQIKQTNWFVILVWCLHAYAILEYGKNDLLLETPETFKNVL